MLKRSPSRSLSRGLVAVLLLIAVLSIAGCFTRRTGIGLAPPRVYPDAVARQSLINQSNAALKKAAGLEASSLNQFQSGRQSIEISAQVQYAAGSVPILSPTPAAGQEPLREPVAVPGSSTIGTTPLPGLPVPSPAAFDGLFVENLDDLTAKEASIEAVRLLYQADTTLLGRDAKLYLVRFDVALDPVRQSRWTYPYRWLNCVHYRPGRFPLAWDCTGFQNYTTDYQAKVHFALPEDADYPEEASLQVYAIQPENENLTVLDSFAWAHQLALAGAFAEASSAAQADYRNRIEEQFAEQRKHPLIRGVIDSPTKFHFIFNPRQRAIRQSMLVSWIPFVGRYTTEMMLEPGVRRVYAYLVMPDPAGTAATLRKAQNTSLTTRFSPPADLYMQTAVGVRAITNTFGDQPNKNESNQKEDIHGSDEETELRANEGKEDGPGNDKTKDAAAKSKTTATPECEPKIRLQKDETIFAAQVGVTARYRQFGVPTRSDPLFFSDADYPPKCNPEQTESKHFDLGTRVVTLRLPFETSQLESKGWVIQAAQSRTEIGSNVVTLRPNPASDSVNFRTARGSGFVRVANSPSYVASDQSLVWLGMTKDSAEDTKTEDTKAEDTKTEDTKTEDTKTEDTKTEDTKTEDTKTEDTKAKKYDAGLFVIEPLPEKPDKGGSIGLRFFVQAGQHRGWTNELEYTGPWAKPPKPSAGETNQKGKAGVETVLKVPKEHREGRIVEIHAISFGDDSALVRKIDGTPADRFDVTVVVPKGDNNTVELFATVDLEVIDDDPRMKNAKKTERKIVKIGLFEYSS